MYKMSVAKDDEISVAHEDSSFKHVIKMEEVDLEPDYIDCNTDEMTNIDEQMDNSGILVDIPPNYNSIKDTEVRHIDSLMYYNKDFEGNNSIASNIDLHTNIGRRKHSNVQNILERALTMKKRRLWDPTEAAVVHEGPVPSPVQFPECPSETKEWMEVKNVSSSLTSGIDLEYCADARAGSTSSAPISELDLKYCSDAPAGSTSTVPTSVPFIGTNTGPLKDSDIFNVLHAGSEEENSDSDDDDIAVAVPLPRVARILLETPEDVELDSPTINQPAINQPTIDQPTIDQPTIEQPNTNHIPPAEHFPKSLYDFEWRPFPKPPYQPELRRESFSHSISGPTVPLVDPYDIFTTMWDLPFLEHIASETNIYAQQYAGKMINDGSLQPRSRICEWKDTNADELYVYFAIMLAMGIVVKSQMDEYWCNVGSVFSTPVFRAHMSLRRFQLLNKFLHFANSCNLVGRNLGASEAKLFKIQPVITHLNNKFSTMYNLKQNIALDESLLQWKGWLSINQFIPSKAAYVGIKSYEICESQSGYLWRFEVHAHQRANSTTVYSPDDPMAAYTPTLVLRLVQGLEHRGHTLWMDSYYNSPALARKLKTLGFDCVGTLRTNRQYVPVELTNLTKNNMCPGELVGYTSGDVDLMVWIDQNRLASISTFHGNSISTEADGTSKPSLIRDYNVCVGGLDKRDQMLATYPMERKRTKVWYKKLFRRLLNVSVLNCYIIHRSQNMSDISRHLTHRQFRTKLVLTLLQKHSQPCPLPTTLTNVYEVKIHYPGENPFIASGKTRQRRVCVVCHKRTPTHCVGCGKKPVCVIDCFRLLHP